MILKRLSHRPHRRGLVAGAAVLALAASLTACGGESSGDAPQGGTLTYSFPLAPLSLNPAKDASGGQNSVEWLAYEPLIRVKSDGTFEPGLATAWEYVGEDRLAFELTIRTDAEFADGTAVTAQSVADTIQYYLDNPGANSFLLRGVAGVEVKDDSTVKVTLDKPNPQMPLVLSNATNFGNIISPAGLADPGKLDTAPAGAGPYILNEDDTVAGDHYAFDKNPKYWNASEVHYDHVVVRVIADSNAAFQALKTGQTQAQVLPEAALVEQAESAGIDVAEGDGYTETVMLMDRDGKTTPALGDPKVRQALNMAIDRESITKALGEGFFLTQQVAGKGTDGYDESLDATYDYDPDAAKAMLAEAGYPNGFEVQLLSTSLLGLDTASQAVADQLGRIGVDVKITSTGQDINKYIAELASQKYGMAMYFTAEAMFSNALQIYDAPLFNPFGAKNAKIQMAFEDLAASDETNIEARAVVLNRTMQEENWYLPVVGASQFLFTKDLDNAGAIGDLGVFDVLDWRPAS